MESKSTLVLGTLLLCLSSFCTTIRGLDPLKHLIIQNGLKVGSTGGSHATNSSGNASNDGSIEDEQQTYVHNAGYRSEGLDVATRWHGVRAKMTIWDIPDVQPLSSSGAYIAALNQESGLEMMAAGFHVNPSLYNDTNVHFFTYWTTSSDYSTGCFNDGCQGFVTAVGSNLVPGQAFAPPFSVYDGQQRGITIRIKKDEKTGDWSLYREDLGGPIAGMTLLGWWPNSMFKYLSDHAEIIQWAGIVTYNINERSPSMGSGHFSDELEGRAASFTECFGFDEKGNVYEDYYRPYSYEDKTDCYDVSEWYVTMHSARRHFFYGGPGGCVPHK